MAHKPEFGRCDRCNRSDDIVHAMLSAQSVELVPTTISIFTRISGKCKFYGVSARLIGSLL